MGKKNWKNRSKMKPKRLKSKNKSSRSRRVWQKKRDSDKNKKSPTTLLNRKLMRKSRPEKMLLPGTQVLMVVKRRKRERKTRRSDCVAHLLTPLESDIIDIQIKKK